MVSPDQQRAAAGYLVERYSLSQRRIGQVMGRSRSTLRYRPRPRDDEPALTREIKRRAWRHPRYGSRRVHAMLVRRGWTVNLKRVRRLWNERGLKRPLRLRKPRKLGPQPGASGNSCVQQPARFKNDVWTCDFIHDRTADGRPLKWLTVVDEDTRECLVLHAEESLTGADVRRIMARMIGRRGAPTRIRSDNGSEFICAALTDWLPGVGAKPILVAAARPWENGDIESFHSRLRDEFLEGSSSRRCRTPVRRLRGTGGSTTQSGRTARWATRRPRSSARPATARRMGEESSSKRSPICANVEAYSHLRWTKKRGAAHDPGSIST